MFPAINPVYSQQKDVDHTGDQNKNVDLIGDGRFDSPGCSAKYGTYMLMGSETNKIADLFTAHVTNAGNSQRMEAYSFQKVIDMLLDVGVIISSLTTDRHKQIKKIIRKIQWYSSSIWCMTLFKEHQNQIM